MISKELRLYYRYGFPDGVDGGIRKTSLKIQFVVGSGAKRVLLVSDDGAVDVAVVVVAAGSASKMRRMVRAVVGGPTCGRPRA